MAPFADSSISRRAAIRRLAAVTLGVTAVPTLASMLACTSGGPRPIAYGREECAWCRMTVSDERFGAELLTPTGKQEVFDSVECLAAATLALEPAEQARAAMRSWVTDWLHPGTLVPASAARYLRRDGPGSPMGKGLEAFASLADAEYEQRRSGGLTMSWDEVLAMVGGGRATRG